MKYTMARYKKATVTEDLGAGTLVWNFSNGRSITLNVDALDADTKRQAMFHGLTQKGSDCYAGSPNADDAFEKCSRVLESLVAGDWSVRREGAGPSVTLFSEAFERWLATIPEAHHTRQRTLITDGGTLKDGRVVTGEEYRKILRETREIKAHIATIQKERAERAASEAKGVSASDLVEVY